MPRLPGEQSFPPKFLLDLSINGYFKSLELIFDELYPFSGLHCWLLARGRFFFAFVFFFVLNNLDDLGNFLRITEIGFGELMNELIVGFAFMEVSLKLMLIDFVNLSTNFVPHFQVSFIDWFGRHGGVFPFQ